MTTYTTGSTYNGFVLEQQQYLSEIDSTVYLFKHLVLGCQALAIKNSDPNKTFCASFLTVPEDSTGVAHILEHSVLMGSKKYPVKDVFGEINKGGLTTFLNAMTGSDTTWYPFATRNMTEYFNIMDVYCDVTFNPLLEKSTFEQEGWHYHLENIEETPQFMGVVFNEMKGAFADPIRALFHQTYLGLMPESTYAHESGGDPKNIPDLSFEQFCSFHKAHYHPSNCTLFLYGDADLDRELAHLQNNFLCKFSTPSTPAEIVPGHDISAPVSMKASYPVQPGSDTSGKTFLAVSSAIGTVHQRKRNTAFQIIANILYNSDASPLKKQILDANLCKDFGGLFLATSCYKTIMMTYLVGSDPDKADSFHTLYQKALSDMTSSGLDKDLVLSELNKYEFSVREEMNKAQRGLDLISKALPAMKHQMDLYQALQVDELLIEIREEATSNGYFEQLIKDHLLDNPATVSVTLVPDPEKMIRTMEQEQQRLINYAATLDIPGKEQLVKRTQELMDIQVRPNTAEELDRLPHLSRSDLSTTPFFHAIEPGTIANSPLLINRLDTNGICYLDVGLDCSGLDAELLTYLDIFSTIATEVGTESMDYMEFAKAVNLYTGGFNHSFNTYLQQGNVEDVQPIRWFHLKTLSAFLDRSIDLLIEVFTSVNLSDRHRIKEIVLREFAWAEHGVQSEGYSLASMRVFSHLSNAGYYNEYVSGATSYLVLKDLAMNYDSRETSFLEILGRIQAHLFRQQGALFTVTGSETDIHLFEKRAGEVLHSLSTTRSAPVTPKFAPYPHNQAFTTSSEVVYNVQGCTLFPEAKGYNGHFEVLKTWISRDFLWNTVRQLGGAYGCFIQFNHLTGNFGLVSYRDPQVEKTFLAYEALERTIGSLEVSETMLNQLIIGTYGSFTPHQGPSSLAATARNEYLSGITSEFKQQRVEEIISTTPESLRSFAALFANLKAPQGYRSTIGSREKIHENAALFDETIEL